VLRLELPPPEAQTPERWGRLLSRSVSASARLRHLGSALDPAAQRLFTEAQLLLAEGKTFFRRHDLAAAVDIARTIAALASHELIASADLAEAIVYRNVRSHSPPRRWT
jgi:Flp pilus assembly protein TadD